MPTAEALTKYRSVKLYSRAPKESRVRFLIRESEKDMLNVLQSEHIQDLASGLKGPKGIDHLIKSVKEVNTEVIKESIDEMSRYRLMRLRRAVKGKVSLDDIDNILSSRDINALFKGKTLNQRIHLASLKQRSDLYSLMNTYGGQDDFGRIVSRYLESQRAYHSSAQILVSETSRAQQEIIRHAGKYLKAKNKVRYKWILSTLPNRKPDICDDYADHGLYTENSLPGYPHTFCYCSVALVLK